MSFESYHQVLDILIKNGMSRKRAKESARYYLTYSSQIQLDVMFNFRSFAHFGGLRNKPNAQDEVNQVFLKMLQLTESIEGDPFHHSIRAFKLRKSEEMLIIEQMKIGKILSFKEGDKLRRLQYVSSIEPKANPYGSYVLVKDFDEDPQHDLPYLFCASSIFIGDGKYELLDKNQIHPK